MRGCFIPLWHHSSKPVTRPSPAFDGYLFAYLYWWGWNIKKSSAFLSCWWSSWHHCSIKTIDWHQSNVINFPACSTAVFVWLRQQPFRPRPSWKSTTSAPTDLPRFLIPSLFVSSTGSLVNLAATVANSRLCSHLKSSNGPRISI